MSGVASDMTDYREHRARLTTRLSQQCVASNLHVNNTHSHFLGTAVCFSAAHRCLTKNSCAATSPVKIRRPKAPASELSMSHSGPCRPHNRDNPNMTTSSEAEAIIAEGAAMRARMERHRIDVNYGMSINAFRELTAVLECNTMLAEWAALRAKRLSQWYRVQEGAHEVARVEEQSPTAKEDTVVGCVPPRAILVGLRRTFSTPNLRKQCKYSVQVRLSD